MAAQAHAVARALPRRRRERLARARCADAAGSEQTRRIEFDPASHEAWHGEPRLTYRTEPMAQAMELTGPLALYLQASSTATDTDWLRVRRRRSAGRQGARALQRLAARVAPQDRSREIDARRSRTIRTSPPSRSSRARCTSSRSRSGRCATCSSRDTACGSRSRTRIRSSRRQGRPHVTMRQQGDEHDLRRRPQAVAAGGAGDSALKTATKTGGTFRSRSTNLLQSAAAP